MTQNTAKLKILFFPYWPGNPYQTNLAAALQEKGGIVKGVADTSLKELMESVEGQDILHLHWTYPYMIVPSLFSSIKKSLHFLWFLNSQKRRGKKLIWTIHNLGEHEKRHPTFELYCHRLIAWLSDGMIVHSHYAQEKTVETYRLGRNAKKIRVIPHGNYIGNYPNTLTNEQARNKLGVSYEKKVFLFLGQIRSYKGLPELIAAFSKISKGSELLILAGKPLDEQIETEIAEMTKGRKDIIYSPEFVSDEDIQIYMKAADVVVFPFRDIFTSGSVLLAMSFSKALIIPDLESLEEIKRVGGVIIYNPDDWSGLEKALFEALTDELVKKGLLNFNEAQRLSWDSIAEETFELYKKAL